MITVLGSIGSGVGDGLGPPLSPHPNMATPRLRTRQSFINVKITFLTLIEHPFPSILAPWNYLLDY